MGPSIWQLLIVLAIVLLLFGTKKLRNMGGDVGGAIRNFKKSMNEGESDKGQDAAKLEGKDESRVIEGESTREKEKQH